MTFNLRQVLNFQTAVVNINKTEFIAEICSNSIMDVVRRWLPECRTTTCKIRTTNGEC